MAEEYSNIQIELKVVVFVLNRNTGRQSFLQKKQILNLNFKIAKPFYNIQYKPYTSSDQNSIGTEYQSQSDFHIKGIIKLAQLLGLVKINISLLPCIGSYIDLKC